MASDPIGLAITMGAYSRYHDGAAHQPRSRPNPSHSDEYQDNPFDESNNIATGSLHSVLPSSDNLKDLEKGSGTQNRVDEADHNNLVSGVNPPLAFSARIEHFTWAWFTLTMSTGGLATLLSIQPHPFRGLQTIGTVFYILNLVLFVALCTILSIRFTKYPSTFLASLKHEREGLFFGPFWLSIATIVTGTQRFVVLAFEEETATREWLTTSIAVAFWCYTVCTFLVAVGQYSYLFVGGLKYRVDKFMPSWLLPIFPIMLSGTIAAVIASDQPLPSRYPILFAGLACKGLGFSVCFIFYAHYLGRLMSTGLPNREHRTAMFIAAGPPSFLALAILGMANAIPLEADLFPYSEVTFYSGSVIRTIALMLAIPLWMLALWFFSIAVVAVALSPPKLFHLGWWGMVFPNTGLCIATIKIGEALNVEGFLYAGNVMTVLLVVMWGFTLVMNVRAVVVRDIMYPGMDEDVAD